MARRLKILLTGSNGFVGGYFVKNFKIHDFEIYKFNRPDVNQLLDLYQEKKETSSWQKHPKLKNKFDVIIHAASLPYLECEKDPQNAYLINNIFTEILSDYCITNNSYFIFFSSVQVYGTSLNGTYNEETKISPKTIYSISKAKAEKYLLDKIKKNYLKGIILRIGNIVGLPVKYNSKGWELFSNSVVKEVSIKHQITIKNNPYIRRNFLSINLLINFLRKILSEKANINFYIPKIINVTMGESTSLMEYAQLVAEKHNDIFNQKAIIKFDEQLIQEVPYSIIENQKLQNLFPNYRHFKIDDDIKKMMKFLKG